MPKSIKIYLFTNDDKFNTNRSYKKKKKKNKNKFSLRQRVELSNLRNWFQRFWQPSLCFSDVISVRGFLLAYHNYKLTNTENKEQHIDKLDYRSMVYRQFLKTSGIHRGKNRKLMIEEKNRK